MPWPSKGLTQSLVRASFVRKEERGAHGRPVVVMSFALVAVQEMWVRWNRRLANGGRNIGNGGTDQWPRRLE